MPINLRQYRIFFASPGDLKEERVSAEGVIIELNQTLQSKGLKLELIKWETHTHPGIGSDPQDVINKQINDEYDIFIGTMWARFGTPTNRAGSGTEEEFNRAYERHKSDPDSIKVMFYFNTKPVPFQEIDPDQIENVRKFKSKLGDKGTLYFEYSDLTEFERYLRLHINKVINELEKNINDKIYIFNNNYVI